MEDVVPTLRAVPVGVRVHEVLLDLLEVLVRVPQVAHLVRDRDRVRVRARLRLRLRVPQG